MGEQTFAGCLPWIRSGASHPPRKPQRGLKKLLVELWAKGKNLPWSELLSPECLHALRASQGKEGLHLLLPKSPLQREGPSAARPVLPAYWLTHFSKLFSKALMNRLLLGSS